MSIILHIQNEAREAAITAEQEYIASYSEPSYCGFAWVDIIVSRTNSKEAKELLAARFQKS